MVHGGLAGPDERTPPTRTVRFTARPKPTTGEAILKDIFLLPGKGKCLLATGFPGFLSWELAVLAALWAWFYLLALPMR